MSTGIDVALFVDTTKAENSQSVLRETNFVGSIPKLKQGATTTTLEAEIQREISLVDMCRLSVCEAWCI